ncbi:MAG: hypothetical protein JF607_05080 [Burkholderiales bacterium]|jgi:hypothetical protein|nr:hypothetical protein [Burkholderiales bacterium]
MTSALVRSLAALIVGLTLVCSASALTITPHQPSLLVAPGGSASAEFDIDFGSTPLDFIALQLDLGFNVSRLSGDVDLVTLNFSDTEPQFALGDFIRANHDGGASVSWVIGPVQVLPRVSGMALLSVPLTDLGGAGLTPLTVNLMLSTLDDEFDAGARMDVVVSAVPEPQVWMLALLGGCGLFVMRRWMS